MILIEKIISLTYHFTRRNDLTINAQVWLKCIQIWRKSDNIVTVTCIIVRINSTIMTLQNNQIHVHHVTIKNSLINLFEIFFVCSIIQKIIIIQLLWQPIIWEYFQLYNLPYLGWLNDYLIFEYHNRNNIVVQECQIQGILQIATMGRHNYGYDQ